MNILKKYDSGNTRKFILMRTSFNILRRTKIEPFELIQSVSLISDWSRLGSNSFVKKKKKEKTMCKNDLFVATLTENVSPDFRFILLTKLFDPKRRPFDKRRL